MPSLSRALVTLYLCGMCLANPYMVLYTGTPIPTPTPPADVLTNEEVLQTHLYLYAVC
jgi:hypothetical protein